jgi:hypothetical protein
MFKNTSFLLLFLEGNIRFVQIGIFNIIIQPTDITCIVFSDLEPDISLIGARRASWGIVGTRS